MKSTGFTCFILLFWVGLLGAQPKTLTKEESFSLDSENDVTKASIQAETEKTLSLQVEFKGFNKKDKEYKITARILNAVKSPMKEFEPATLDLDPRSGVADFLFNFVQKPGVKYSPEGIESRYIEVLVTDKAGAGSVPGLESLGINSRKFLFRFQKKWKVKIIGQEIMVSLSPIGSVPTLPPASVSSDLNHVKLTQTMTTMKRNFPTIKNANTPAPEPKPEPKPDQDRQGPAANKTYSIFDQFKNEYNFKDYFDVLNINRIVFEDINTPSGYYYYYPKEYQISWEPVSNDRMLGYNFKLVYLQADASGKSKVMLTLRLEPNITSADLAIANELVKNALRKEPGKKFFALQSIPLSEASKISFKGLEGILDPKDVEITVPSDLMDPIVLIIKTDRPDDLLTLLFTENGLIGNLSIKPTGNVSDLVVPITIKMDHQKTFGTAELNPGTWRTEGWKNQTPYPLLLKNLHMLRFVPASGGGFTPQIYTWSTGNKELSEGGIAKFDPATVPAWLDTDPLVVKMWMEYAVKHCDDCNTEVRKTIMDATVRSEISMVTFDILDVLAYTGAARMRLKVRSAQLDPEGKQKVEKNPPFTITRDNSTLESFQLFVPKGLTPQFEYAISLVMPDGDIKQSSWVSNKGKTEIGIGQKFVLEQFPELKKR